MAPALTLHVLPPSHPCMTAAAALELKGLEYEKVALPMPHTEEMERLYGPGRTSVPGLTPPSPPPSPPSRTGAAAPELKGREYKKAALPTPHTEEMERLNGPGRTSVPGLTIDGDERVHGSIAILERLERLVPDPPLY